MKISNKNYLDQLNDRQSEAITHLDGPCLIVAGAGSGKTRVLTSRVVEIIKKKKSWAKSDSLRHIYKQSCKRDAKSYSWLFG